MIVSDSDVLVAALDRRMLVGRVAAPDAPKPAADGTGDVHRPTGPSRADLSLAARLPLGRAVTAEIVALTEAGDPIADIAGLRVALSWPGAGGAVPAPGSRVALRVLAHVPTLLFEGAAIDVDAADPSLHLSIDALSLQAPAAGGADPLRFTTPILSFEHASPAPGRPDEATALPASATATSGTPPVVLPLLLQGPAWPGQDVELVVRRERNDEVFDNAALDRWCGELIIDLPTLGRVSSHLSWSIRGLRIRIEARDDASVASMTATSAELAVALSGADLPLIALTVGRAAGDATPVDHV